MPLVTIDVTQDCIDAGVRGWCSQCPIAIAANRVLVDDDERVYSHVTPNLLTIFGGDCGGPRQFQLPDVARQFINDFDNEVPVTPFQFTLDILAEFLREPCTKS